MVNYQIYLDYFINEIYPRIIDIVTKPFFQKSLLWIILPLFITLILIQVYFGRYKNEELGWNTAFSNSVSLLWVTTTLFRFIYEGSQESLLNMVLLNKEKIILISILAFWAIISIFLQFYHILPKKIDFLIYSSIPVYVTSILFVILIIGNIVLNLNTLYASLFIFFIISFLFFLLRHHIKAPKAVEISLSLRKKYKKEARDRKINEVKRKIKDKESRFKKDITRLFNNTKEKINKVFKLKFY